MENGKVLDALKSANSMCRSAMEIARRDGKDTNWEAFRNQLMKSLETQQKILYPTDQFLDDRAPGPHRPPPNMPRQMG